MEDLFVWMLTHPWLSIIIVYTILYSLFEIAMLKNRVKFLEKLVERLEQKKKDRE